MFAVRYIKYVNGVEKLMSGGPQGWELQACVNAGRQRSLYHPAHLLHFKPRGEMIYSKIGKTSLAAAGEMQWRGSRANSGKLRERDSGMLFL